MRARTFVPVLLGLTIALVAASFFLGRGQAGGPAGGFIRLFDLLGATRAAGHPVTAHEPITRIDVLLRLMTALLLSALIGMEREYHRKPAGLRTNAMVGLGACLMTLASVMSIDLFPEIKGLDPTRIAAQIVTGIGFIGAGAILRPSSGTGHIVGLTTAATLWVVCGLGIAVGLGFYAEAIVTTILVFFTFFALNRLVRKIQDYAKIHPPHQHVDDDDGSNHETREH